MWNQISHPTRYPTAGPTKPVLLNKKDLTWLSNATSCEQALGYFCPGTHSDTCLTCAVKNGAKISCTKAQMAYHCYMSGSSASAKLELPSRGVTQTPQSNKLLQSCQSTLTSNCPGKTAEACLCCAKHLKAYTAQVGCTHKQVRKWCSKTAIQIVGLQSCDYTLQNTCKVGPACGICAAKANQDNEAGCTEEYIKEFCHLQQDTLVCDKQKNIPTTNGLRPSEKAAAKLSKQYGVPQKLVLEGLQISSGTSAGCMFAPKAKIGSTVTLTGQGMIYGINATFIHSCPWKRYLTTPKYKGYSPPMTFKVGSKSNFIRGLEGMCETVLMIVSYFKVAW